MWKQRLQCIYKNEDSTDYVSRLLQAQLKVFRKWKRVIVNSRSPRIRSSEAGVFQKNGRSIPGITPSVSEAADFAMPVRKALRMEVRRLSTDIKKEAAWPQETPSWQTSLGAKRRQLETKKFVSSLKITVLLGDSLRNSIKRCQEKRGNWFQLYLCMEFNW